MRLKSTATGYKYLLLSFIGGIILGAMIFSGVERRSILAMTECDSNCFSSSEALGVLASVVVQKTPLLLPGIILETDKTIVMKHPAPQAPIHYVVIPKKDFSDPATLATEKGMPYLLDAFRVIRELAEREDVSEYRIITNGPGLQDVNYVHFHFRAQK